MRHVSNAPGRCTGSGPVRRARRPAGISRRSASGLTWVVGGTIPLVLTVLLQLSAASPAAAEDTFGARLPLEFRSWTLEAADGSEEKVEQLYLPIVSTLWVGPATSLVASTAGATSSFESPDAASLALDGASDVELQVYHRLPEPGLLFFGGVRLPSGKKSLTEDELRVAGMLSHPVLGMRLREFGRGFEANGGVAWSLPLGTAECVLGAGGRYAGGYDLAAEQETYTPSPDASASVGVGWKNADWQRTHRSASLQVAYRIFGDDEVGGRKVFREGNQLEIKARTELPAGSVRVGLRAVAVIKEQNTAYGTDAGGIRDLKLDSGTGLWGGATLRQPVGDRVQVGADLDVRAFDGNAGAERDGTAIEAGPAIGVSLGQGYWVQLSGRYLTGTLGQGTSERDLSGFAAGATFSLRPF